MRIRSIRPEFWSSEDIAALPWDYRLIFIGLWSYVDDNAVGRDIEKLILADLFPLEDDSAGALKKIHGALSEFSSRGLATRYTVDGKPYIHVTTFSTNQVINRPSRGRYPLPTCEDALFPPILSEPSVSPHANEVIGEGEKGRRGEGEKGRSNSLAAVPAPSDADPEPRRRPEIRLPATWTPTDAHRAQAAERRCDLTEQVQAFRNHADTNDRRCRNWNSAFTTWLGKSRPSQTPGRGTTDQRVLDHLALADRMQAEDDAQHDRQIGA